MKYMFFFKGDDFMPNVSIKPEFYPYLVQSEIGNSLDDKVNTSIAIFLFTDKKVTLARAAELADKSIREFIDILISHNIPWLEYSEDHKTEDDDAISHILSEL